MARVTGKLGIWGATATVAVCFWGCTNTVRPVDGPGSPFGSGTGGFSGEDSCLAGATGGGTPDSGVLLINPSVPEVNALLTATVPPPAISGGTLLMLSNGTTAVAADEDRDQVYVVDISSATVSATVTLSAHDQPGRLVEDGAGLVHVVLRGAGAIATIDPTAGKLTMRRSVCSTPRGIAYGASSDRLYLACASGQLMVFTPTGTTPSATWSLDQDLRDVVVDGDGLLVTRFRSAEVLEVDATSGAITGRQRPTDFSSPVVHNGATFEPVVAWRAAGLPGGGMVMAHQRGMYDNVEPSADGYSSGQKDPCGTIVHSCVSKMKRGGKAAAGPAFPQFVLPVDIAVSPKGDKVAVIAAGNGHAPAGTARRLFVGGTDAVTDASMLGCGDDDTYGPAPFGTCFNGTGGSAPEMNGGTGGGGGTGGIPDGATTGGTTGTINVLAGSGGVSGIVGFCGPDPVDGQEPVAVAFAGQDTVLVQTREPASLLILRGLNQGTQQKITVSLSSASRADLGHALFHSNSGGGLACASCHPEGHDDGRVWSFDCEGQRRTQDPSGGLIGTEPFHWNGDLANFQALVREVFMRRMSGPPLTSDQMNALQGWVNQLSELPPLQSPSDSQVAHGATLFQSPSLGCASCHTGVTFTNNASVDVGTGASFQVPSLRGVGWRAPYMHDGCAATLSDRFTDTACGGGDKHGVTSQLSDSDRSDLIAYLQSL